MLMLEATASHEYANKRILAAPDPVQPLMQEVELCAWVASAEPGQSLIYYQGHLGFDRMKSAKVHPDPVRKRLAALAARALTLAEDGWVLLVQERISCGNWAYRAVKSRQRSRRGQSAVLFEEILELEAEDAG